MNKRMSELLLAIKGNYYAAMQFDAGSGNRQHFLEQAKSAKTELYALLNAVV